MYLSGSRKCKEFPLVSGALVPMTIGHRISAPDSRKNAHKCEKTLPKRSPANGYPKGTVLVPLYQAQWRTMAPLCLIQGHSLGSFSLSSLLASFATAQHHPKDRPFGNNAQTLLLQCPFLRSPLSRPQHSKLMRFKRISIKNRCFFDPGRSRPAPALKFDTFLKDFN